LTSWGVKLVSAFSWVHDRGAIARGACFRGLAQPAAAPGWPPGKYAEPSAIAWAGVPASWGSSRGLAGRAPKQPDRPSLGRKQRECALSYLRRCGQLWLGVGPFRWRARYELVVSIHF